VDHLRGGPIRKEIAMSNDRNARLGALSGALAVVLIMVGYSVATQDMPDVSASAAEWQAFASGSQSDIQTGTTIVAVGVFFFVWFLGSLRSALAAAEGGTGRLSSIAYAGGIASAGFFVIGLTAMQAAAFRTDSSPDVVRGLFDVATVCGAPAAGGFTALFTATAIIGYRHRPVPAPVAGFSALSALAQPLALGAGVTDHGAFAADGFLGLWLPVVTFALAILTLSIALYRRPSPAGAAQ
jgi:hypothetical protein